MVITSTVVEGPSTVVEGPADPMLELDSLESVNVKAQSILRNRGVICVQNEIRKVEKTAE